VRLFFERALEINPDDDDIWLVYLDFHREKIKDKNMILLFLKRATKCCYFNYVFWVLLIRQMESLGSPYEEIQTVISRAYNSAEERNFISEIWKATLEYSLRNFDYTVEQLQSIRQTFSAAINDIQNKGNSLYIIKILNIWADFEVYKAKDEIQMNELMNRVVKLEPSAESWKAFLNYTKVFGNVESIRKVYKRALSFCKDEKNLFAEAWVMCEKM
jgi:tetratricopeptide (TPR) repeat protein